MNVRMMAAGLGVAVVVATASPALGKPGNSPGKPDKANNGRASSTTTTALAATSTTAPGATATPTASTQPKKGPKKFTHVGTVKALAAGSLTIQVQGGNRKAKGSAVTVKVPASARITRNGKRVPLSALQVGDHVQAKGSGDVANDVKAERRSAPSTTSTTVAGSTSTTSTPTSSTTSTSSSSTTSTTAG